VIRFNEYYLSELKTKNLYRVFVLRTLHFDYIAAERTLNSVQNGTVLGAVLPYHFGMKVKELTRRQLSSVRCPTCGVAAGERCETSAGGFRFSPHADRKLLAAEAVEKSETRKNAICGKVG
jgi:hypothetical protein